MVDNNTSIRIQPSMIITVLLGVVIAILGWAFKELYQDLRRDVDSADSVLSEAIGRIDGRVDRQWEKYGDLKDKLNEHRVNHP